MATRLWLLAALAGIVAVGAIAAIAVTLDGEGDEGAFPTPARAPAADGATGAAFWDAVRPAGSDRLHAPTLDDLREQADAVVLGVVAGLRVSRVVRGDTPDASFLHGLAELRVDRVVAGRLDRPAETIAVELAIRGASYEEALARLRRAAARLPRGPVLAFLTSVDRELARQAIAGRGPAALPEQAGLYIPHSSVGLFAATGRAAVDTPLGEPPTAGAHPYREELRGVRSLEALADRVARAASEG